MTQAEKDLEEYVKRYSIKHNITHEEAKQHQLVKDVKAYYEEMYENRTIPPGLPDGSCQ